MLACARVLSLCGDWFGARRRAHDVQRGLLARLVVAEDAAARTGRELAAVKAARDALQTV